ncbi:MAG: hydantoinase/oxoprolinase family protein [Proteobacteria bacterium]|nr:hydantoinase/oxoprolinase family protein [Pseudomonadota bacterium]
MQNSNDVEVGVDIGGTFTDVVCRLPDGRLRAVKLPTTHADPSRAVGQALTHLAEVWQVPAARIAHFSHGTTLATNAVLERKGARIGLITTEGFRDVLEIGRQFRRSPYELEPAAEAPTFLIPGALRKEVRERVSRTGEIVVPLNEDAVLARARELVAEGAEAIAICFVFSFMNPAHELRARALIHEAFPAMLTSISYEVDPAFREYERTCITAFDAYVKPILDRYLTGMEDDLRKCGVGGPLLVMLSRGGKCSARIARQRPVRLFLSGPAAGVIGGCAVGNAAVIGDLITFDMGGTSCDVALVVGGKLMVSAEGEIGGFPVRVPLIDVHTIGAGGGSIAWIDGAGTLRVGPRSAGSEPGPVCYGRGGTEPTVTDASLVLGYLDPENFAGGSMRLDPAAARQAVAEKIARPLGLSVEEAARGIHRVVNAQMAEAVRSVSVYRGADPRRATLLPLGGAGPLHAVAVAAELQIERVLVPPRPGVLSACGLLVAPVEHERSAAFLRALDGLALADVDRVLETLDAECMTLMAAEAVDRDAIQVLHFADMCYVGQSYHLEVPFADKHEADPLARLYADFCTLHDRVYGHAMKGPANIVNLRAVHRAQGLPDFGRSEESAMKAASVRHRMIVPVAAGAPVQATIYDRWALRRGDSLDGPAIVEQSDTTTIVAGGWRATVDASGNLMIEVKHG